ncbi:MAG: histidine triad nucleotide-binding protein [Acidimicrobiales bacterium]
MSDRVPDCLFCRVVAGEVPADVVHEDELTVAFRDISPVAPTHVLVVPRRHIEHAGALTSDHAADLAAVMASAQAVAEAEGLAAPERGYRLVCNVGPDALNSVPHLHVHVIGGRSMSWPPG